MNFRNVLTILIVSLTLFLLVAGCAVHLESTFGAGSGTKYAAAMRGGRGAGIDFPPDAENISKKSETIVTRAARD